MPHIFPAGYQPTMDLIKTQKAIKLAKDTFEHELAAALNLTRVSAPLFVERSTGLNDDLNGFERPVQFDILEQPGVLVQIVHSLAKWKRFALARYNFPVGEGLYTDMNAIRRDETTDNLHSLYVDQWDWEKAITREDRTPEFLRDTVYSIHDALRRTLVVLKASFPEIDVEFPEQVSFITTTELERLYPGLAPDERESAYVRAHGAAFFMGIGWPLANGKPHDGRAPDYDDWSLNGDLVYYHKALDSRMEISSMGIRVDEASMRAQLAAAKCEQRAELPFHKALLAGELPLTMGGGIGQSRLCMLLLGKAHIGEVQSAFWPKEAIQLYADHGVTLL
ncbi:MAG: aspartate--ammonia ligase [Ruminococcaceae bacterium]|nr:aspartate--ammonia ligase [Oscillospiraceae bacterium]